MRYRSMSVLLSAAVLAVTNLNHVAAIVIAPGQDNQTNSVGPGTTIAAAGCRFMVI